MEKLKINIKLESSIITPFHSDTLWGHICWALRYKYGESDLKEFLECYRDGEPPLVISNAFSKGYIPFPVLPQVDRESSKQLIKKFWGDEGFVTGVSAIKLLSKTPYISREILIRNQDETILNEFIIKLFLEDNYICPKIADYLDEPCPVKYGVDGKIACGFISNTETPCPLKYKSRLDRIRTEQTINYHSKINRLSCTTSEGSLFTTEEIFFGNCEFEAFCKIGNSFSIDKLKVCLEFINNNGYGRKKTTGKGNIKCNLEKDKYDISTKNSNAFMSLSNYVPGADDPKTGYYRIFTKYGKLGGHFASSPIISGKNPIPFKYPLVMFEAGSVFKLKEEKEAYGRIVNNMHVAEKPQIAHYGIAYSLPLKVGF